MRSPARDRATPAALVLFVLLAVLCLGGAARADLAVGMADEDLRLVREWREQGRLSDMVNDASHLPKAGWLLYLRATLPHLGSNASENRRFLFLNAVWLVAGAGAAARALSRRFGARSAALFLAAIVACVALRDSADYVASEAPAAGVALLLVAGAVSARDGVASGVLLGAGALVAALLRPNVGLLLLVVLLVVAAGSARRAASVAAGFLAAFLAVFAVERATHQSLQPFGRGARVLLWGTADYYWRPDVPAWPVGTTPGETSRLEVASAFGRWREFFRAWSAGHARALRWRLGHSFFSAEELPPRWRAEPYVRADRTAREWWWAFAALLCGAAVHAALTGTTRWRLVPILVIAAIVAQGLLFGADPRLALPFLPILFLGLAASATDSRRAAPSLLAATLVAAAAVWFVARTPDVADYDFSTLHGAGRRIAQRLPRESFPESGRATVVFRLLQDEPATLGLTVLGNDAALLRREPLQAGPWPATFGVALDEKQAAEARRSGFALEIRTLSSGPAPEGSVYFPVVPPLLGGRTRVDGTTEMPSGYGGEVVGAIPAWVERTP